MRLSLKQLLDTEIPYQSKMVAKAELKVFANPIRQGSTYEETQKMNQYDTTECVKMYFTQLRRLEQLRQVQVKNSLSQMLLIKEQENLKSEAAFYKKFVFPAKVYQVTIGHDENRRAITTENTQAYHDLIEPKLFDHKIEMLEAHISTLQQQINQLNTETFVEVPDRV